MPDNIADLSFPVKKNEFREWKKKARQQIHHLPAVERTSSDINY